MKRKIAFFMCLCLVMSALLFQQACGKVSEENAQNTSLVLNVDSKKIHLEECFSVKMMLEKNKRQYCGKIDDLLNQGYTTCGNCFR